MLEPLGSLPFEDAVNLYKEIMAAGAQAGADMIAIETMSDLAETRAALIAAVAFHQRLEDPEKARLESEKETEQHWGAFHEDGTLMAHIINNQFTYFLDGKTVAGGGIGAVSTLPEYRNTGAVREIFQRLLPAAYADGEVISTLYPFSHAFYR